MVTTFLRFITGSSMTSARGLTNLRLGPCWQETKEDSNADKNKI